MIVAARFVSWGIDVWDYPNMIEQYDETPVQGRSRLRLVVSLAVGALAGSAVGIATSWGYGAISGWAMACVVYNTWVWIRIWGLDASQTRLHALREDPGRRTVDIVLLLAALAAVVVVVYLLISAHQLRGAASVSVALLAIVSIALTWFLVHTLYTLRYARLYYGVGEGTGIDFNQSEPPGYSDFVYLAFTLGMTFQVSDTNITNGIIRRTIIHHVLLSYLFGTVIVAATVNLLAGIA